MANTAQTPMDILHNVAKTRNANPAMVTMLEHIMAAESAGDCYAKNGKSSACGLFQFLDQTWLATMQKHGAQAGYAAIAGQIQRGADGKLTIDDTRVLKMALDLRFDAKASCEMGIAFTRDNQEVLSKTLGREPTAGELYLAHFLGAGGAKQVLSAKPDAPIAELLGSKVMEANASVRLVKGGVTKRFGQFTVADIQHWAAGKMEQEVNYEQLDQQRRQASWRKRHPRATAQTTAPDDYSDMEESLGNMTPMDFIGECLKGLVALLCSAFGVQEATQVTVPMQTPRPVTADPAAGRADARREM